MHRSFTSTLFLRLVFKYEADIENYAHSNVIIGAMDKECPHYKALMFEPLNGLLIGTDPDSNCFLKSIRTFNACFQMTSFGATEIIKNMLSMVNNSIQD